jgi:hypothetical protein
MRRLSRAMLFVALLALAAPAAGLAGSPPKTVVIDGREYGPKDGLQVDTMQLAIVPGSGPVGITFDGTSGKHGSPIPQLTLGTSYAISTETLQIRFDGKAKAAGNIYSGKRIIQVCIWYTRGGTQQGDKVCSNALDDPWRAGPEKTTWCWDSLNPFDPQTQFVISTVRIDPRIL